MAAEPLRHTVEIAAPRTHVFEVLTRELADWWPREFTFSGDRFRGASIDHLDGGEWFEVNESGEKVSWGRVLHWDAPERLLLTWRVSVNRTQEAAENASEIEITLKELDGSSTLVELEHRDFERHGTGAEIMRTGMDSAEGWPAILQRLKDASEASTPSQDDGHQIL